MTFKFSAIATALILSQQAIAEANANNNKKVETISVYGSVAQSLKAQQMKQDKSVIADFVGVDALGKLPENNIAEAAGRLPGVSVVLNFETGEGKYVTIRGLDASLNTYSVNGVRMATSGGDRRVSLQSLPPEGVKSISVTKTLTPNLDGDALGGAVDVELFNAFDFDGFQTSFSADYSVQDRSDKSGTLFSGSVSNILGDDWGIYLAGYVGNKDIVSEESENWGRWEPQTQTATNQYADQHTLHMQGDELDRYEKELNRYGVNFSLDRRYGDDNRVYLRGSYNDYTDEEVHRSLEMRNYPTARANGNNSLYNEQGQWDPVAHRTARRTEFREETENQAIITIGGEHNTDMLAIDYAISHAKSETSLPKAYGIAGSYNTAQLNEAGGILFDISDPRYPQFNPRNGEQGLRDLQDMTKYRNVGAWDKWEESEDKRLSGQIDFSYQFNSGSLTTIDFGAKYSTSERNSDEGRVNFRALDSISLADDRIKGPYFNSHLDGRYSGLRTLGGSQDINAVYALINNCDTNFFQSEDCNRSGEGSRDDKLKFEEDILAAYVMGTWNFGAQDEWEVISGIRYEYTEHSSDALATESRNGQNVTRAEVAEADYDNVLPSFHVNYRPSDEITVRGAIWTSFTRPAFSMIAGQTRYNYDGNEIDSISRKNINLKPQESTNLDISFEYYMETGYLSVAAYHKDIDNYLVVGASNNQTGNQGDVLVTEPTNLDSAEITGIELGFSQQLTMLPAPFDGLGFNANVMFQDTKSDNIHDWRNDDPEIVSAPDQTQNLSVYWEQNGWEARISYQRTGKYLQSPRDYGIDKYHQALEYVDMNISYIWEEYDVRVSFEAKNLTEEASYFTTSGSARRNMMDYVEGGRVFNLGLSWNF
ncbi:TonB-dependent receptor [Psychrobium sp. MM17-31]|uniref:TonB-dependent receptor n=1 Tax=Psychrobium sp. MM17-31 TaxID=2917758 RepID=UPI001EF57171|nr:TonB-dependent receptor [Psychrobium sp. MM17-31]MCG7530717.1 TonB-dependent receptor [Psychrobium sp. MM17-31]